MRAGGRPGLGHALDALLEHGHVLLGQVFDGKIHPITVLKVQIICQVVVGKIKRDTWKLVIGYCDYLGTRPKISHEMILCHNWMLKEAFKYKVHIWWFTYIRRHLSGAVNNRSHAG